MRSPTYPWWISPIVALNILIGGRSFFFEAIWNYLSIDLEEVFGKGG